MHEYCVLNGEVVSITAASIPAVSAAALYGRGVFTTIAIVAGEPFLWQKHWNRLKTHTQTAGIDISALDHSTVTDSLRLLISTNQIANGRARVTVFDASGTGLWVNSTRLDPYVLILTAPAADRDPGPKITASSYAVDADSPLAAVKSCNYFERLMALEEARGRGCSEAICVNRRGEIVSAIMANVFWLKNGKLFTPSLSTGCLAGTTREYILENLECYEVSAGIDELKDADAIFLTSAGRGISKVSQFDGREMPAIEHPISQLWPNG